MSNINYSTDGNPNSFLNRKTAIDYLVDCCINGEETEWASASVRLVGMGHKTKADALKDIREVAAFSSVRVDDDMISQVYDIVEDNLI